MLHRALLYCILRCSYGLYLLLGLLPASLDWRTHVFRLSRVYLIYSACLHIFYVGLISGAAYYAYDQNFMPLDPVLRWTYTVTNFVKVAAALLVLKEVWCQRRCWMTLFDRYRQLVLRYKQMNCLQVIHSRQQIEKHLERYLISKCTTTAAITVLTFSSFSSTQEKRGVPNYMPMMGINLLVSLLLLATKDLFFFTLCQLQRQFLYVQLTFQHLQSQVRQLTKLTTTLAAVTALTQQIHALTNMHADYCRLAQCIFKSCQTTSAAIMLRLFVQNVRIVHHVVWFIFQSESADTWATGNNLLLMIFFYWDAALLMGMVEGVLTSGNGIGQLLRQCRDAPLPRCPKCKSLSVALEQLAMHLKCHRLTYRVYGLFDFNKEAMLRYFLTVFVQVTVLVQFDLKYK